MQKRNIELMVGLFVLLGVAGLIFLALKAANLTSFATGSNSYLVTARFDNIGGLKVRAPVRSAGVNVGRVVAISLDPKSFQGLVQMELDPRVQFPKDSSARILTAGLLGDQYVGLEAGADAANLAAGDVITSTTSALVLESLIGQFLFNRAAESGADTAKTP